MAEAANVAVPLPPIRTRRVIRPITEEVDRIVNEKIRTSIISTDRPRTEIESVDSAVVAYRLGQAARYRVHVFVPVLIVLTILAGLWAATHWSTIVNFVSDPFPLRFSLVAPCPKIEYTGWECWKGPPGWGTRR